MRRSSTLLAAAAAATSAAASSSSSSSISISISISQGSSGTVAATPHDSYSSSVGVLGCKINTNRVAYWPPPVSCDSLCIALAYGGRRVHLLHVDQSAGAHDISYDAWNYLLTGRSAMDRPTAGGPVDMAFEYVDAARCRHLMLTNDGHLPLSAANSINFVAGCLGQARSWVAHHHTLFNILDPVCSLGHDEVCELDWANKANQPSCSHTLGMPAPLRNAPVYNIRYPTGERLLAASSSGETGVDTSQESLARRTGNCTPTWALGLCGLLLLHLSVLGS